MASLPVFPASARCPVLVSIFVFIVHFGVLDVDPPENAHP
jgi:hypothetical protein